MTTSDSIRGKRANEARMEMQLDLVDALDQWFYHHDRREVGTNQFGRPIVATVVTDAAAFPGGVALLAIEQNSRGSAEFKVCYLHEAAMRATMPVILVFFGAGFSEGVIEHAQDRCDGRQLIAACGLSALRGWLRGA